ncbi:MAG: hypothetical protein K0S32_1415 [Bacteroidetes bacterium]|jgi:hypothetical protein|nr:hypothetical protein [Bacteroidota bacterium]
MEIVAVPFGVKLDKVKAVFGCRNPHLYDNIIQTKTFKDLNKEIRIERELHNIIFKYVPSETYGKFLGFIPLRRRRLRGKWVKYGHALLTICDYLGKDLSSQENVFYYGKEWWRLNTLLRENGSNTDLSRMISPVQLFDTPFEKGKICNNYYSKTEIKELMKNLEQIKDKVDEETLSLYVAVMKGLDYCIMNNCEWISFSYQTNMDILKMKN